IELAICLIDFMKSSNTLKPRPWKCFRQFLRMFCSMCHRQSWLMVVGNTFERAVMKALSASVIATDGGSSGNTISSV
ncbi:hypothetical protein V1506DRAFT_445809, partial [Lipomyces tetrasporus]